MPCIRPYACVHVCTVQSYVCVPVSVSVSVCVCECVCVPKLMFQESLRAYDEELSDKNLPSCPDILMLVHVPPPPLHTHRRLASKQTGAKPIYPVDGGHWPHNLFQKVHAQCKGQANMICQHPKSLCVPVWKSMQLYVFSKIAPSVGFQFDGLLRFSLHNDEVICHLRSQPYLAKRLLANSFSELGTFCIFSFFPQ